jgi:hypothetical protein
VSDVVGVAEILKRCNVAAESRAKLAFAKATVECREVIKQIVGYEREVMHLLRRNDIHTRILETIKRITK